jgi:hypothetical protein
MPATQVEPLAQLASTRHPTQLPAAASHTLSKDTQLEQLAPQRVSVLHGVQMPPLQKVPPLLQSPSCAQSTHLPFEHPNTQWASVKE